MAPDYVTQEQCKERRDACHSACQEARSGRDSWINKLERKIDQLIWIAIGQLCALVLTLIGVILAIKFGGA